MAEENVHVLQTLIKTNQEACIEVLERMLQMARDGQVAAVAVAFVRADRVSAGWTWSSSDCAPAMVGSTAGMQLNLAAQSMMNQRAFGK